MQNAIHLNIFATCYNINNLLISDISYLFPLTLKTEHDPENCYSFNNFQAFNKVKEKD